MIGPDLRKVAEDQVARRKLYLTFNRMKWGAAWASIYFVLVITILFKKQPPEDFWKVVVASIAGGFGGSYLYHYMMRYGYLLALKLECMRRIKESDAWQRKVVGG